MKSVNKFLWQERYDKYLKSDHWQTIRRVVFERDKHKCVYCKCELTIETMVCHHISYKLYNRSGRADAYECRTLCHHCHAQVHHHLKDADALTKRILKSIRASKQP